MIDPAWINAGARVLSSAVQAPPAGPAIGSSSGAFHADGWTVAFGGNATGAPINKTTTEPGAAAFGGLPTMQAGLGGVTGWLMLAVMGGLAWRMLRKG